MQIASLKDVCEILNGGTPKTKVPKYWDGPHAWLTPAEMGKRDSPYIQTTKRTLTDEGIDGSSAKLIPANSVILSTRAPIGHLAINTVPMAFNQGCRGLVPGPALDHKYLYYFLLASVDLLNDLGTGTTFKELSATRLKSVEIPILAIDEQRRIVAILDEAFAAIDTAAANAEKNLANARRLYEAHLDTVFSAATDAWTETVLGSLCEFKNGINFTKHEKGDRGLLTVDVLNMYSDEASVAISGLYRVNKTVSEDYHLVNGDILFVRSSVKREGVGWPALFNGYSESVSYCGFIIRARELVPDSYDPTFLVYFLRQPSVREYLVSKAKQATITNINQKLLSALPVQLPPRKRQQQIVAEVITFKDLITKVEAIQTRKIGLLIELRQSILQQAFTCGLTSKHLMEPALAEASA